MREEVGEKRRILPRRTFWRKMYAGAGMSVGLQQPMGDNYVRA